MKTIGFLRNAKKHAALLEARLSVMIQKYLDGVNAFIQLRPKEHHLEFKLAGIKPTPWSIEDSVAVSYVLSWDSAANLETEIVAQLLVEKLGPEKAKEIFPLNLNPDEPPGPEVRTAAPARIPLVLNDMGDLLAYLKNRSLGLGSNNWVVGPSGSAGGKPILANDTHQDARLLPGLWYPIGLITPEVRAVGVNLPGTSWHCDGGGPVMWLGGRPMPTETHRIFMWRPWIPKTLIGTWKEISLCPSKWLRRPWSSKTRTPHWGSRRKGEDQAHHKGSCDLWKSCAASRPIKS